jgi:hypothetical protein
MALAFTVMLAHMIRRGLLQAPVTARQRRIALLRFGSACVLYPCAVVVGLVFSPLAMLLCYLLINGFYIFEQTPILPPAADADVLSTDRRSSKR